jgi:predicted alpha/beta superfamily hydrolase
MKMNSKHISISLLFSFWILNVGAQQTMDLYEIGTKIDFHSVVLNENRPLIIYTPESYEQDSTKIYPVIYLLDGGGNFHHTSATVDFLSRNGRIPEMIVVAIRNTIDRTHDLTPETLEPNVSFPTAGGADSMLIFMEKELFPFIKKEYRINEYKILIGHSFGGLFAIHTLINHPGIFNSYLSISPSLWWDNQDLVLNQTKSFFENNRELTGHIYITMGNENNTMVGGAWKLIALLEEKGPPNLKWEFNRMTDESHGSIPMLSTYKGLEFIFKEWNIEKKRDALVMGGTAVLDQHLEEVEKYYGIEVNMDENFLKDIAQNLVMEEKFDLALGIFRKNALLHPDSWKTQSDYGALLVNMNKMEEAIPFLKNAIKLNPEDKQSLVSLRKTGEDVSGLLPMVDFSDRELRSFAGKYLAQNGMNLLFEIKEKSIWISGDGTPRTQLLPLEKNLFFVDMLGAELSFTFEGEKVVGFLAKINGQNFPAKKIE